MIKKVISENKIPIKIWTDDIEPSALEQASNLANLSFAFKHIAIMPDVHLGYGMPIGGVLATQDVIIPNAVGVDIGCGMCAVKTSLREISVENLKRIMGAIRHQIPTGFKKHSEAQNKSLMPSIEAVDFSDYEIISIEFSKALHSLGTLGGGNHFIEIQQGSDGFIWIMIHSGSRNLGKTVADHYNKVAIELNKKWHSGVPANHELAFLPTNSEEGENYIREMNYCVEYAFANRKLMMNRVMEIFKDCSRTLLKHNESLAFDEMINIAHNYASLENHFGSNVWVHRKGATLARKGLIGIIPGSQGTKSYIVEGLGEPESFTSCSHGAGRTMGRKEAKRTLDLASEIKLLDDQGIVHGIRNESDLDEAPSAYKDINKVIANQDDLIVVKVELKPLAVVKG